MKGFLQDPGPENRSAVRILRTRHLGRDDLERVRPVPFLACEHMFPSVRTSALAQRALDALWRTRSFLLLEDDHEVDWEVDENEPFACAAMRRTPLRGVAARTSGGRRPGRPAPAPQVCTAALEARVGDSPPRSRSRPGRTTTGRPQAARIERPAASYSPRPSRTKYHRR